MTKRCPRCQQMLDQSMYNWKIKGKRLATYCRDCSRAYVKDHYNRHPEYYIAKARKRNILVKAQLHAHIENYLMKHPCVDCGESDLVVLEFDHRDPEKKFREIALIIRGILSLETLEKEIEKCDVRCANCHRRKTARENGSWKLHLLP